MNFKTFGAFIVLLGLIVAAYGGYQLYRIENDAQQEISDHGVNDQWGTAWMGQVMIRENADSAKKGPMKTLGIGGLIVFIGIGITVAAKKQKPEKEASGNIVVGKFL